MKVTIQREMLKEQITRMFFDEKMEKIKIANELGIPLRQVRSIISRQVNKDMFGKSNIQGIHFGSKQTPYQEGFGEMACHSNYQPTFSWDSLSRTEKSLYINPEHLIDFKQTLQRLKG